MAVSLENLTGAGYVTSLNGGTATDNNEATGVVGQYRYDEATNTFEFSAIKNYTANLSFSGKENSANNFNFNLAGCQMKFSVKGGAAEDIFTVSLPGKKSRVYLQGGGGNDRLILRDSCSNNIIYAESADGSVAITQDSSSTGNSIYGGEGDDNLSFSGNGSFVFGEKGNDTIGIVGDGNVVYGYGYLAVNTNPDADDSDHDKIEVNGDRNSIYSCQMFSSQQSDGFLEVKIVDGEDNVIQVGRGNNTVNYSGQNSSVRGNELDDMIAIDGSAEVSLGNGCDTLCLAVGAHVTVTDWSIDDADELVLPTEVTSAAYDDTEAVFAFADGNIRLKIIGWEAEHLRQVKVNQTTTIGELLDAALEEEGGDERLPTEDGADKNASVPVATPVTHHYSSSNNLPSTKKETIEPKRVDGATDQAKNSVVRYPSRIGRKITAGQKVNGTAEEGFRFGTGSGNDTLKNFGARDKLNIIDGYAVDTSRHNNTIVIGWSDGSRLTIESNGNSGENDIFAYGAYGTAELRHAKFGFSDRANNFIFDAAVNEYFGNTEQNADSITVDAGTASARIYLEGISYDRQVDTKYHGVTQIYAAESAGTLELAGSKLADTLAGGVGCNSLWGGSGFVDDTLVGGTGINAYFFGLNEGHDTVKNARATDKVMLYNLTEAQIAHAYFDGASYELTLIDGSRLTIENILAVPDIVFVNI